MNKPNAKHASILLGFLISILGTAGSHFFLEGINKEINRITAERNEATREIERLQAASSEYFLSSQQGDMFFALSLGDNARQEIVSLLYRGNLLDRATPIRNLIGALAIAKVVNYTEVYGKYEKLNDAAREQFSLSRFMATKEFERQVVDQAAQRIAFLQQAVLNLRSAADALSQKLNSRQRVALGMSGLGTTLLLFANLLATKPSESPALTPRAETAEAKETSISPSSQASPGVAPVAAGTATPAPPPSPAPKS